MRAMVLSGPGKMDILEKQKPRIQHSKDVLLKILAVGVCGSDIHYYRQGRIGGQVIEYPFAIGHECSAEVIKTGPGVTRVKPGDLAAVDPAVSCGFCDQCRSGRPHTCRELKFLGCPGQMEGCLQDFMVLPEKNCFMLPAGIDPVTAVLIEPLSIAGYAVSLWDKPPDPVSVAVLGSGPVGLCSLLALKEAGMPKIYMTDKVDARLKAALDLGAVWAGYPEQINGVDLDAVFECCGEQDALDQAVSLLKPGGRLLIIGIPETDRVGFNPHSMRRKEIRIQNVRRQNHYIPWAVKQMERTSFPAKSLVTHIFSLDDAEKAFELAAGYKDRVIKAVIRMGSRAV